MFIYYFINIYAFNYSITHFKLANYFSISPAHLFDILAWFIICTQLKMIRNG